MSDNRTEQAIAATLGKQGYYIDRDDEGTHIMCVRCGEYIGTAEEIAATLGSDREAELQKALNKAAGNWAKADAELRKALDFMRIWISEDAHLGESAISREFEKAEGLRKLDAIRDAIAATLGDTFAEHLAGVTQRQDERIAALEGLVKSFYAAYHDEWPDRAEEEYAKRMKELGVM